MQLLCFKSLVKYSKAITGLGHWNSLVFHFVFTIHLLIWFHCLDDFCVAMLIVSHQLLKGALLLFMGLSNCYKWSWVCVFYCSVFISYQICFYMCLMLFYDAALIVWHYVVNRLWNSCIYIYISLMHIRATHSHNTCVYIFGSKATLLFNLHLKMYSGYDIQHYQLAKTVWENIIK